MDTKPEPEPWNNATHIQAQNIYNSNNKSTINEQPIQEFNQSVDNSNVVTDMIILVQGNIDHKQHIKLIAI
eukprot:15405567-Heterocapsa_arctica.AAC.1